MRMDMLTVIYSKFCITTYMVETKQKIYRIQAEGNRSLQIPAYHIQRKISGLKPRMKKKIIALRDKNFFSLLFAGNVKY